MDSIFAMPRQSTLELPYEEHTGRAANRSMAVLHAFRKRGVLTCYNETTANRFSKLTTFSAILRHEGSDSMMLLFMGEKNREHWTREDAKQDEVHEISINITGEDLKKIDDWYWLLRVTNFDSVHTTECSLRIEYQE